MKKSPSARQKPSPDASNRDSPVDDQKANQPVKPRKTEKESETAGMIFVIADDHSGRDEMNLAGNPFALLHSTGKRATGAAHIKYQWNRRLPTGKTVLASWEVNGHGELGLPGPSDEMLYLVLLELTREEIEDGQWPQTVHFYRGALLDRLGWPRSKQGYTLLSDCFARLSAVNIQARHSFYDAKLKAPAVFASFNILDDARIFDEPRGRKSQGALPLSYFKWSDQMHASFNAGNVRSLALDFVISLEIPTARRLFRYLDMHRNAQTPPLHQYKISLAKLRDHIGMVNFSFMSKVKERLALAHEELIERGYLAGVEYRKGSGGHEIVTYTFADGIRSNTPLGAVPLGAAALGNTAPVPPPLVSHPGAKALSRSIAASPELCEPIYPQEAFTVFQGLPEAERERLRQLARRDIEPAFWDRLEKPDSPMALVLWEIVARELPVQYRAELSDDASKPSEETETG